MAWKATDRPMTTVEIKMYSSSSVRQATGGENCRPEMTRGPAVQEVSVILAGGEPMLSQCGDDVLREEAPSAARSFEPGGTVGSFRWWQV